MRIFSTTSAYAAATSAPPGGARIRRARFRASRRRDRASSRQAPLAGGPRPDVSAGLGRSVKVAELVVELVGQLSVGASAARGQGAARGRAPRQAVGAVAEPGAAATAARL